MQDICAPAHVVGDQTPSTKAAPSTSEEITPEPCRANSEPCVRADDSQHSKEGLQTSRADQLAQHASYASEAAQADVHLMSAPRPGSATTVEMNPEFSAAVYEDSTCEVSPGLRQVRYTCTVNATSNIFLLC